MKAFVCHTITPDFSGVEIWDIAVPEPAAGEVRVKIRHASVNFTDLLMCQGRYQHKPQLPFVPGTNISAEVDAVGDGVSSLKEGDSVVGAICTGGFAEYAVVAEAELRRAPQGLSSAAVAAYPTAYLTAYVALVRRARLQEGEVVLVHGASGGVGLATVDLAKLLGATVIATSGVEWKLEKWPFLIAAARSAENVSLIPTTSPSLSLGRRSRHRTGIQRDARAHCGRGCHLANPTSGPG